MELRRGALSRPCGRPLGIPCGASGRRSEGPRRCRWRRPEPVLPKKRPSPTEAQPPFPVSQHFQVKRVSRPESSPLTPPFPSQSRKETASPLHSLKVRLPTVFDPDRRPIVELCSIASPARTERALMTTPVRCNDLLPVFDALSAKGRPTSAIEKIGAATTTNVHRKLLLINPPCAWSHDDTFHGLGRNGVGVGRPSHRKALSRAGRARSRSCGRAARGRRSAPCRS